ncbi:MAG: zinc ribbon domain-containing protein [Methylotenera sp.]
MQCSCGTTNVPNAKFCKGCGIDIKSLSDAFSEGFKSCPSCNTNLKQESKFCEKCGYKFVEPAAIMATFAAHACPSCSVAMQPGAKFCGSCGHSLSSPEPETMIVAPLLESHPLPTVASIQLPILEPIDSSLQSMVTLASPSVGINKMTLIGVAVFLSVIAAIAWFSLHKTSKGSVAVIKTVDSAPAPPSVAKPALVQQSSINPVSATPAKVVTSLASNYIGQNVKPGAKLDKYYVGQLDRTKNMIVLKVDDESFHTKLILVTNMMGKVVEGKDIIDSDRMLVGGKEGCVLNQKPYPGVYVAASVNKMTSPTSVWKLSDNGTLIDQVVPGIECGVFEKFDGEETDYIGYNIEHHKLDPIVPIQPKPKAQTKRLQPQAASPVAKVTPQKNEQKVTTASIAPKAESTQSQQQESTKQDEPQNKQINSFGSLFEKLGESVKKGATESVCSSSERAMNQCK